MEKNVKDIKIGDRIRQDIGDISQLKESIKRYGMLNPIVITKNDCLIAGFRRLQAAKELGWSTVTVRVMPHNDDADLVEIEIDENLHRKPFTEDERTDALLRLEKLRNPSWFTKLLRAIGRLFQRLFGRRKTL